MASGILYAFMSSNVLLLTEDTTIFMSSYFRTALSFIGSDHLLILMVFMRRK